MPIRLITLTNATAFRLLLAIVLAAPLALGGQRPWAWTLLAVAVGALLLAWGASVYAGSARAPVPFNRIATAALLLVPVLLWAMVQASGALPSALWHPLWVEAAAALDRPVRAGVSVDWEMTRTAVLRLATYAGVFVLALQLGRERSRARLALMAVAVAGTGYALYGITVHYAGWERILWLEKWAYEGDLTSTFVNRNAYGAYAGLGVLCCVALFIHGVRPRRHDDRRARDVAEVLLFRALPFLVAAVVVAWALMLSHSRGAFLATGAGLAALLIAAVAGRLLVRRAALAVAVVVAGFGIAVAGASGDVTLQRLIDTPGSLDARSDLFRLASDAVADAPWTGHGFGAFLPAFRVYRDSGLAAPLTWEFAHNVHLEMAMDLGLPGAIALYAAFAVLAGACAAGLRRRRRDQIYPAVALAAVVLVGAHGLVDFSAQIPAVALTLALLLGVGVAQSWRSADHAP